LASALWIFARCRPRRELGAKPLRVLHVNLKGGREEGAVWIEAKLRVLGRQDYEIKKTTTLTLKHSINEGLVWCFEGMVLSRSKVCKFLLLQLLFEGKKYFLEPEPWPQSVA
jgi:hypothetical protein